jgi:hypothetical protein
MQEARRYHVSIQILANGQAPAGVVALDGSTFDLRPDQVKLKERKAQDACIRPACVSQWLCLNFSFFVNPGAQHDAKTATIIIACLSKKCVLSKRMQGPDSVILHSQLLTSSSISKACFM